MSELLALLAALANAAIIEVITEYSSQTGRKPESFLASSPGAWHAGTAVVGGS